MRSSTVTHRSSAVVHQWRFDVVHRELCVSFFSVVLEGEQARTAILYAAVQSKDARGRKGGRRGGAEADISRDRRDTIFSQAYHLPMATARVLKAKWPKPRRSAKQEKSQADGVLCIVSYMSLSLLALNMEPVARTVMASNRARPLHATCSWS